MALFGKKEEKEEVDEQKQESVEEVKEVTKTDEKPSTGPVNVGRANKAQGPG